MRVHTNDDIMSWDRYEDFKLIGEDGDIGFLLDFDTEKFFFIIGIPSEMLKPVDPLYFAMLSPIKVGTISSRLEYLAKMIRQIEEYQDGNQP